MTFLSMMKEQIEQAILALKQKILEFVPEVGDFETIIVEFSNPDESLFVEKFWFEVAQPPVGVENRDSKRALYMCAKRKYSDAVMEVLTASCNSQQILEKLDNPEFIQRLVIHAGKLGYHLQDLH